tara:strand:+ start:117 stop:623 length:507 start_codon:yes stop_codon:yes gene_type:complete
MYKQDWLSVVITLIAGIFTGAYFYTTGFLPLVNNGVADDRIALTEFSVTADMYGGCRNVCPSFHVNNDGEYRVIYGADDNGERLTREGVLPLNISRQLKVNLTPEALAIESEPVDPESCNSDVDGLDLIYEITVAGETYFLDSCGTAVDGDGELWQSLATVWDYFNTI